MKKILFPTDFSDTAKNALEYATALAKNLDAKIDLVSVYRVPTMDTVNMAGGMAVPVYDLTNEMKENTQNKLNELAGDNDRIEKKIPIYGVFISDEITQFAEENKYDLIVMGTKGERDALEKMLGSVTTDIMKRATCPILAVPSDSTYHKVDHIAFATDFAKQEDEVINQIYSFSQALGAKVYFVHAAKSEREMMLENEVDMTEYDSDYGYVDFTIAEGKDLEHALDNYIKAKNIDVLVMFMPRRKLWERLFHSSFTKQMTFHTSTPLLIVKE